MRDQEYNPISQALSRETEFITNIDKATLRFFEDSKLETLHSSKGREIKSYRDDENMCIYILDKNSKEIRVMIDDIPDYNKTASTKKIISWQYLEKNGKMLDDLFKPVVIVCDIKKKPETKIKEEDKIPKTEEEFINNVYSKVKDDEEGKKSISMMLTAIKEVFGEKFLSNTKFINRFFQGQLKEVESSRDAGNLQQFSELLNTKGYMSEVYPDKFFSDLNKEAFPKYQEMLPDWIIGMNSMIKACEENKHTKDGKAFEFNDLDNHVWIQDGSLVLTNQNIGFYFKTTDSKNFTVYFLDEDKDPEKIDTKLNSGTIKELKDVALKVEDGKITGMNYSLMYCFELDMEFSVKAMKEEGILKVEYPVDITSYKYQKDYYAQRFGSSEFEFVTQAMMTLGGGFEYDKKTGTFIDDSVKYIPNLPEDKDTRGQKFKTFNYLNPKKISHLNADWLDGLKYAVEVLKRDMPKPTVFEGDNEEDALKKAIKYYEIKIAKLENLEQKPKI